MNWKGCLVLIVTMVFGVARAEVPSLPSLPPFRLTRGFLLDHSPHLTINTFGDKVTATLKNKKSFEWFRSFVRAFFADLRDLDNLGPIGPCLGDAHPINFSFREMDDDEWDYIFDDIDDAGVGPILLDILRNFVTLRYLGATGPQISHWINFYANQVLTGATPRRLPLPVNPDEIYDEEIRPYRSNGGLDHNKLSPLESGRKRLTTQLESLDSLAKWNFLDFAEFTKWDGGSGGMSRYWILGRRKDMKEIFEVRRFVEPSISVGSWKTTPRFRAEWIKENIWMGRAPKHFGEISFDGASYFLLSRLRHRIKITNDFFKAGNPFLSAQLAIIAQVHRKTIPAIPEEWKKFLFEGSAAIKKRWIESHHFCATEVASQE